MKTNDQESLLNVNVAIIGSDEKMILSLIEYWLSLKPNDITVQNIFSKIFWANNEPIQINIYYFLSDEKMLCDITWHSIVYLMDHNNLDYILEQKSSYQCILELIFSDKTCIDDISNKYINQTHQITHYVCSIANDKLVKYLDEITTEAYQRSKIIGNPLINNYVTSVHNMEYFEDVFYIPTQSCCILF